MIVLTFQIHWLDVDIKNGFLPIMVSTMVMAITLWLGRMIYDQDLIDAGLFQDAVMLVMLIILGTISYFGVAYFSGALPREIWAELRRGKSS